MQLRKDQRKHGKTVMLVMIKEKLGIIGDTEFDRMMPLDVQTNRPKPYKIISKPTKFDKDKQKILKNAKYLKDTGIFIYEDLCKDTMEPWRKYGINYWNIANKINLH